MLSEPIYVLAEEPLVGKVLKPILNVFCDALAQRLEALGDVSVGESSGREELELV